MERRGRDERSEDTLQDPVAEGTDQNRNKRKRQNLEKYKLLAGIGPCTMPPISETGGKALGELERCSNPQCGATTILIPDKVKKCDQKTPVRERIPRTPYRR